MARPCRCETCRLCWLYHNRQHYRDHWDGVAVLPAVPACRHRGAETGEALTCPSCRGSVRVKLLACAVHGDCTAAKALPGHACCAGCPDFTAR